MIKSISVRELRPNISKVMDDIQSKFDRYIVSRYGKPEVILMSIEDYESLVETIEIQSDKELMKRLEKAQKDKKAGKGRALEDIHKDLKIV